MMSVRRHTHMSLPSPGRAALILLCASLSGSTLPARAQTGAGVRSGPSAQARARITNTVAGTIAALNDRSISIRTSAGAESAYRVTPSVHILKSMRPADLAAFKPGDNIVLRFRRVRGPDQLPTVTELADALTWPWLDTLRHKVARGTISGTSERRLTVSTGGGSFDYTVTARTLWLKAGAVVQATAFKAGDPVYILPRSLPGGGIMARAVTDTTAAVAVARERLARSISGLVERVDPVTHTITVLTRAGQRRVVTYTDATTVLTAGQSGAVTGALAGRRVRAGISRASNAEAVTVIRVLSSQSRGRRARPATP